MTRRRLIALLILTLAGTLVGLSAQRGNDRNRDEWQKIPEIFAAMSIGEGSVVADVGAGSGFFTTRLSGDDGLTQVSVVQGTTTERCSKPFFTR
jgi:predicted methyltransferase